MKDHQGTGQFPGFRDAPLRDRVIAACTAGCSCETKTPDIQHHDPICRYRVLMECLSILDVLPEQEPDETADERRTVEVIKVGPTQFGKGVPLRIVLERIERGYEYAAKLDNQCRSGHFNDGRLVRCVKDEGHDGAHVSLIGECSWSSEETAGDSFREKAVEELQTVEREIGVPSEALKLIGRSRLSEKCHRNGEWAGCWRVRCNLSKRCTLSPAPCERCGGSGYIESTDSRGGQVVEPCGHDDFTEKATGCKYCDEGVALTQDGFHQLPSGNYQMCARPI